MAAPACLAAGARAASPWVATWGTGMVATDRNWAPNFTHQTLREIVHTSVGGSQVRVWFSNRFGRHPLTAGAAHIAIASSQSVGVNQDGTPNLSGIQPGSDRTLSFHHNPSVTIPPGATIVSDPVAMNVSPFTDLAVSIYFPGRTLATTEHQFAYQVSYAATGNVVSAPNLADKSWTLRKWYVLSGVDVYAPGDSTVIALGDSITDGAYSTLNENRRWPDDLARRLAANASTKKAGVLGVVNAGIGGNRVLLDGYGPNAVSRVDWDVLARSGARYLIVLEGVNDISRNGRNHQPYDALAERLESGLAQLVVQAHRHKILVLGATLTPVGGCRWYSPMVEKTRQTVNHWIRTSKTFDGVVDFDKAVRDPQNPLRLTPRYDSGDHIHPSDAGYQAMANAIDLTQFATK
jgi:lysophospholipase L1-like esterase